MELGAGEDRCRKDWSGRSWRERVQEDVAGIEGRGFGGLRSTVETFWDGGHRISAGCGPPSSEGRWPLASEDKGSRVDKRSWKAREGNRDDNTLGLASGRQINFIQGESRVI